MLSILYPENYNRNLVPINLEIQQAAFKTLGCERLVGNKITNYFSDDPAVLAMRNELFAALIRYPELCNELSNIGNQLNQIYETLDYMKKIGINAESNLRSILTARSYITVIRDLADVLDRVVAKVSVRAIDRLHKTIQEDLQSEDFARFEAELERFNEVINHTESITVGVNLDAQFRPKEAGLISINTQSFKSGNFIDRFMRLDFKRDEYCCIAPLTSATREMAYTERFQVDNAVNQAFEKVLKHTASYGIKHTIGIIEARMYPYAGLLDELSAISPVLQYITRALNAKMPLCVPSAPLSNETFCALEGFYDARLLEKRQRIVLNDLNIDEKSRVMILTGPNSGGKTVVLRALAMIGLFASLGIPLPARKADWTGLPMNIFVAFSPDNGSVNKGRLEQECVELGKIYDACHTSSIVFLDEPFSTTSQNDAIELLHEYVGKMLQKSNTRLVITTHFHQYAEEMQSSEDTLCYSLGMNKEPYVLVKNSVNNTSRAKNISNKYW